MDRRVVVTGMGVVSAIGDSIDQFWGNCLNGEVAISNIPNHWYKYSNFKSQIWSKLPPIDFEKFEISRVDLLQHDMVSILSLCAGKQAIENSKLEVRIKNKKQRTQQIANVDSCRIGVYMGTGSFGAHSFLDTHTHQILSKPKERLLDVVGKLEIRDQDREKLVAVFDTLVHSRRFNPFTVSRLMPNAVSAVLGIKYAVNGPTTTTALACAAGTSAIGQAFRAIRDGYVDLAITGGSEYWDDYYGAIFRGFDIANTLVQSSNCPFDADRSGFLFSQGGSAVLILEDLEAASARGANILAEIVGFSESFDAYSMMSLDPDGKEIERMLRGALRDAKIDAKHVDYVNAHGTGTVANDIVECRVLDRVFGSKPKVNSTKSLLGHTIGASGALEAVVAVLSLLNQTTHICKNLKNPIIDLNFVYEVEQSEFEYAFSHSFAFGGHNAGLVLKGFH